MITVDPNKTCFVFDVDGTLTDPRNKMNLAFANEFSLWMLEKQCFLATGSDYKKVQEQVPWHIINSFKNIFCCMGNEVRDQTGKVIVKSEFTLPDSLEFHLGEFLKNTKYHTKVGNHLEFRTGMVNFSIVGRKSSQEERKEYNKWDKVNHERKSIVEFINNNYPTLNASIGGSISIDIIQEGSDKGQIVHSLENAGTQKIIFVGDKCFPGGNDWGVVRELERCSLNFEWYQVNNPSETLALIRTNKSFDGGK